MASPNSNTIINIGVKEILQGISNLETSDLELFYKQVANLLANRKSNSLSKRESQLFLIINKSPFNKEERHRYVLLYKKLQDGIISDLEHAELKQLIQRQEVQGVARLKALVELAQIRKTTLDDLMKELGIRNITPDVKT